MPSDFDVFVDHQREMGSCGWRKPGDVRIRPHLRHETTAARQSSRLSIMEYSRRARIARSRSLGPHADDIFRILTPQRIWAYSVDQHLAHSYSGGRSALISPFRCDEQ